MIAEHPPAEGHKMIKKIISGGQTGADRAALDFAIKYSIPHCGWIPKGRKAEDGTLPNEYRLQEMPSTSYPARTEQNVIDSDGTLIYSRGKPNGGTDYTRKMVLKHRRQLLHVDLSSTTSYDAASLILSWIEMQHIKTMNVAGPRASKDPDIYADVFKVLSMAFKIHSAGHIRIVEKPAKTVDEAVDRLISELPLRDKSRIANMDQIRSPVAQFQARLPHRRRILNTPRQPGAPTLLRNRIRRQALAPGLRVKHHHM
jgi:Circularly permutated YpsA SLOG family